MIRVRGAIGMGLTWAAGWALCGLLIGVASILLPGPLWDAFFKVFDAPLPAMAVPGFLGGAFFSMVLGIAGRRRRFEDLSLPRFAAWGAVGGLLLTLFPFAMVAVGLAHARPGASPWPILAAIVGPFVLLSAISAAGTLMVARLSERRDLPPVGEDAAEARFVEGNAHERLGSGDPSLGYPARSPGERF